MKKEIFNQFKILIIIFLAVSCQEDEPTLNTIVVPTNLVVNANVASDNSGNVTVTPTADNALNFHIIFTPEAEPVVISSGQSETFRFTQSGEYSAPITVVAFGAGGVSSSATVEIDLDVRLRINAELLAQIAGGDGITASSRRWVWDQNVGGHFGVGPLTNDFPEFFSAGPSQINPCMYDDVLTFSHDGNDNYTYALDAGETNETFINWTEVNRFFPDASPQQFNDECRVITDQAIFETNFVILDNEDGTRAMDIGNSFLSYWAVIPGQYEILELSENRLAVRGISQPFNGDDSLAWYSTFVPEEMTPEDDNTPIDSVFETLVWSDEFDVDGAPNPANWTYDIGAGGWGNNEVQYYRRENAIVADGVLKITAKKENFSGSEYTSSRMLTQGLFGFTYGKVEVRAKLPAGGGTWPAIWMLGENFPTVGWPACGEIDIMEHVGNNIGDVSSALHNLSSFGNTVNVGRTNVPTTTEEFHTYAVNWTFESMEFSVDGVVFYTYSPEERNANNWPYDANQFMILNIAMGGTLGGQIDSAFTEDSMEIDYVRVYQ